MECGLGREHRRAAGGQPLDRSLAGLCVHPAVIDGLDPGTEEPVELGDIGGKTGLDLDEELDAHRLEGPLDLAAALWLPWPAVHQTDSEAGTSPQQLLGHHGTPVVEVHRRGHTARGQRVAQRRFEAHRVL